MRRISFPVPDFIPTPISAPPAALEQGAYRLYQIVADSMSELGKSEQKVQSQIKTKTQELNKVIAALAVERFEYDRLIKRISPHLREDEKILNVMILYAKTWDANLRRAGIEIRDLTGQPLTDELVDFVEVESAVPDPSICEATVKETIVPLILHNERIIGLARVVTAVPLVEPKPE